MLTKRTGFPPEDIFVLCTVTGVQPHAVFCRIDDYDKTGLIHISEIAPGRIKNIREYVQEGKKVVCKILRVDQEKGHIDLSLRRVNEMQRRETMNAIKQEQLAEKILEVVAKMHNKPVTQLYDILSKGIQQFPSLFSAFEAVSQGKFDLAKTGLDKTVAKELIDSIKNRIKPPQVEISGDFHITTYASDGIDVVRAALVEAEQVKGSPLIRYKGAGTYQVKVTAGDYKSAEKTLKEAIDVATKTLQKSKGTVEFVRNEK